jgi:hypothetical protein
MPRRNPPNRRQTHLGAHPLADRSRMRALAALPREGRVQRQTRRAFIAHGGQPLTMTELRHWCFAGRQRQHWHYWSITRALHRLGALPLGRAGRAGIWALKPGASVS